MLIRNKMYEEEEKEFLISEKESIVKDKIENSKGKSSSYGYKPTDKSDGKRTPITKAWPTDVKSGLSKNASKAKLKKVGSKKKKMGEKTGFAKSITKTKAKV